MEGGAEAPSKTLEGDALSAPTFTARLRPCPSEWGGAAPHKNRTTRRSSLQKPYGRRRGSAIETLEGDALSAPIFPAR